MDPNAVTAPPFRLVILMAACRCLGWIVALTFMAIVSRAACAGARVELEIYTDERVPLTGPQEWLQRLGQVGVTNLQIRGKQPTDTVGIEQRGTEADPVYRVTGAITSNNDLILPGGKFTLSEAGRAAKWLKDLARHGSPTEQNRKRAFGLNQRKLDEIRTDLAQPAGFSTAGMSRAAAVEKIARKLQVPLEIGRDRLAALEQEKVAEDLIELSCGTALACVLRPAGLCLVPGESEEGKLRYEVVKAKADLEVWPVGWPPEKPERDTVPAMYEFLNVNIQGVAVTDVLKAIGGRVKLPVLMDHNALARHGIQPEKVMVSLPQSRTTYSLTLRKALFQARLKHELRVDEAGTPFLWVTTIKPL